MLDRLHACQEMRIRTSAANTREKLWNSRYRLPLDRLSIESFEFLDLELDGLHLAIPELHIETGGSFYLGDFSDGKFTEL
jgi:hypothetical protein